MLDDYSGLIEDKALAPLQKPGQTPADRSGQDRAIVPRVMSMTSGDYGTAKTERRLDAFDMVITGAKINF